jgi:ATP-dependent 26S proteasome regulatory subunit
VKALEDINCALTGAERPQFYGYGDSDYKEIGGYDPSIRNMAEDIKKLVKQAQEYQILKTALKPLLGK